MKSFKVCFIGGAASGKSSFKRRCFEHSLTEDDKDTLKFLVPAFNTSADEKYSPTMGVDVTTIMFKDIRLNIWDTAGNAQYRGIGVDYYVGANVALAFYTKDTVNQTNKLVQDFKFSCPDAYIIHIWNKTDLDSEVNFLRVNEALLPKMISMSVKDNINCDAPFNEILKLYA